MAHYDLIIRGARIVAKNTADIGDIAVNNGVIERIGSFFASAEKEIDAKGLTALPGGVDCHVHFNSPGHSDWETFENGSAALAAGGVSAYFDMPLNSLPVVTCGEAFDRKLELAQRSSYVDFALWGGLVPGNIEELPKLAAKGAVGFKAFTCFSGLKEFPAADDYTLYRGMQLARELGLPVAVHCENETLINGFTRELRDSGKTDAAAFIASRPPITELEPISRVIMLAKETGCALHIAHVSTPEGAAMVSAAKKQGCNVSCETVPQYFTFSAEQLALLGAAGKCCPPLREGDTKDRLWQSVLNGEIDMICSDHSPAPQSLKSGDDFFKIWGGISGCQTTLPTLLTVCSAGKLALPRLAQLIAANPAERFGIESKGAIEPGKDADFTLVDMSEEYTLKCSELYYLHKHSPMAGMPFKGKPKMTILRGRVIYDGALRAEPGFGRFLRPCAE